MGKRQVVVTGIGSVTPLGLDTQTMWRKLLAGESGIDLITAFDTSEFATKIAGEVKGFDPEAYFDKKDIKKLDRYTQFAIIAAREAIKDSGLNLEKENRDTIGVIIGSGIGGILTFEEEHRKLLEKGPRRISPFFIPQMISDIAAGYVSMEFGIKGPNFATVSACATSAHAIGLAMRIIQYGDSDIMVCGGAEAAISPMGVSGFNAMKAISTRNNEPQKASRPFDRERDGFVIGEGSGIVILEEKEHAQARGARIYAELAGQGFTADAFHITQPAPGGEGSVRSMQLAIKDAGLEPKDIQYINAHGTSTPPNDKNETAAIKTVFGDYARKLKVSSTKSMTGHLLGATGSVEMIISSLVVQQDKIPPTINYENPDPECDLDYVPNKAIDYPVDAVISNSLGFGGHNASLCIRKIR
ncbi:MAG: beta-ketoacyl-ACP synthase II [Calditrichaceae bacterium]|nr:beta-ketoacyl-ACP synthase II [Calditrichaceae bacterium]MBN2707666.1 beta-ketoacyl-ACP synthase II [Calditrichaceae bacterium]RQV94847.1 MAG: beta-ketoacyl-[acyl-carrier-protein] synthase II [Calditrichota bacterium]